jgi:tetratricopeptide (TPR) repeat protein
MGEAHPDELLGAAVDALRRGDTGGARALAEQGLQLGTGDATPFHAFLGMLAARADDRAAAALHLRAAHEGQPGDVTIACNLIAVLIDSGEDEAALEVVGADFAFADFSLRLARCRAFLTQKLEMFEAAVEAHRYVLKRAPNDFETWNNLGNALSGLGDHAGTVEALRRAVSLDPSSAPVQLNLAAALRALGDDDAAEAVLREAMREFPVDARPAYELYVVHKGRQRQDAALAALEDAASRDTWVADYQLKLGIEYGLMRRTAEAETAYRRAIELEPQERDAFLGLAILYEHTNREDDFGPLAALARANGVEDGVVALIEALELRRVGRFAEALARIDEVPAAIEPERTAHIRATLLARLER